jgi:Flp pilus assembly pilin Flp
MATIALPRGLMATFSLLGEWLKVAFTQHSRTTATFTQRSCTTATFSQCHLTRPHSNGSPYRVMATFSPHSRAKATFSPHSRVMATFSLLGEWLKVAFTRRSCTRATFSPWRTAQAARRKKRAKTAPAARASKTPAIQGAPVQNRSTELRLRFKGNTHATIREICFALRYARDKNTVSTTPDSASSRMIATATKRVTAVKQNR